MFPKPPRPTARRIHSAGSSSLHLPRERRRHRLSSRRAKRTSCLPSIRKPASTSRSVLLEAPRRCRCTEVGAAAGHRKAPALGTDVTNEYVKEIPLLNRNFFGLVFSECRSERSRGFGNRRQLSFRHEFRLQRSAQCDGGDTHGWCSDQRPRTGRRRKLQRLLRAVCRSWCRNSKSRTTPFPRSSAATAALS